MDDDTDDQDEATWDDTTIWTLTTPVPVSGTGGVSRDVYGRWVLTTPVPVSGAG